MIRLVIAVVLGWSVSSSASVIPFAIPSKDGLSTLRGQIDLPACAPARSPAVILVAGTGLFTRDTYFGLSKTSRDLIFKDLSDRIANRCLAAVRFDYRGVSCDMKTVEDISTCLDEDARSHVSDDTILDDIQVVFDFAATRGYLDPRQLYFLGHSEGSMNVARLIARGTVQSAGLLFVGGVTESARGILRWQVVDRSVDWSLELDENLDGVLTNEEIERGYATSRIRRLYPKEVLLDGSRGFTTKAEIVEAFENYWRALEASALAHQPSDPYYRGQEIERLYVFSSYKWWQRWFTDDVSMLENLKGFEGPIRYHNGDIDMQTPGLRELEILRKTTVSMKSVPEFVIHEGRGHGLSSDFLFGPIDETLADAMADELAEWARHPETKGRP